MNEKLKEIEQKCYEKVPMYTNGFEEVFGDIFNKEKFAELIIKECIEIVNNSPVERGEEPNDLFVGYNMALDKAVEKIKEHFGVEK